MRRRAKRAAEQAYMAAMITGDIGLINQAIAVHERLVHRASPGMLTNLGVLLKERFERLPVRTDIDRSVGVLRMAVDRSEGRDHAVWMGELSGALRARFERYDERSDIDEAVQLGQQALTARGLGDSGYDFGWLLYKLGGHLLARAKAWGVPEDHAAALTYMEQAVNVLLAGTAEHEQRLAADALSNLCGLLRERSEAIGSVEDAVAAVEAGERSLRVHPEGVPIPPRFLSNLAVARTHLHRLDPNEQDVQEAIDQLRQALSVLPWTHSEVPFLLHNLALALRDGYEYRARHGDFDGAYAYITAAVEAAESAVAIAEPDSRLYQHASGTLAACRSVAAIFGGLFDDSRTEDSAIADLAEAAARTTPDDPDRARLLTELANALGRQSMFADEADKRGAAQNDAIVAAQQAVDRWPTDHPNRAVALFQLGQILRNRAEDMDGPDLRAAIDAFVAGAEVAGASPYYRINCVTAAGGASAQAGRMTDAFGYYRRAVELLPGAAPDWMRQTGREHWLASLSGIASTAAAVAVEVDRVDEALELLEAGRGIILNQWLDADQPEPDRTGARARVSGAPVVVLNASRARCDALVITGSEILVVPLANIDWYDVTREAMAFVESTATVHDLAADASTRRHAQQRMTMVLGWLWDEIAEPVLTALEPLAPSRVCWLPAGAFSYLPIHAAGHHTDGSNRTVLDRLVSSYTPTLRALGAHLSEPSKEKVLVVAMPETPGADDLPIAALEATALAKQCAEAGVGFELIAGADARRATVTDALTACTIAHLACHGKMNPVTAAESSLLLHDHETEPLTVDLIRRLAPTAPRLAYLSACETGRVLGGLADEPINPGTAFLLAGFPQVIATLWTVPDHDAAAISAEFYRHLLGHEPTEPALALHQAVLVARAESPEFPSLWASHIHLGGHGQG